MKRVKYNDGSQGMTYQSRTDAVQQGQVTINCFLDESGLEARRRAARNAGDNNIIVYRHVDPVNLGVDIGDIVFTRTRQQRLGRRSRGKYSLDQYIQVFSSANGLFVPRSVGDGQVISSDDEALEHIMGDITFVGIASTKQDFVHSQNGDSVHRTALVVQIGGVISIHNTGDQTIRAGDWVYVGAPSKSRMPIEGISNEKALFSTNPYRFDTSSTVEEIVEKVNNNLPDSTTTSNAIKETLKMLNRQRKHVIGRAITSAHPGERFDIHMCSYSC